MRCDLRSRWITAALVLLAVPNLVAGSWGTVATRSWFDDFPGWAPRLVAAVPPYNEHLAADAAAGLLAAGVAATIAIVRRRRDVVLVAMAVLLAFSWPHAAFHLRHPADALTTIEDAVNTGVLWAAVVVALLVGVVAWRSSSDHQRMDYVGDE